MMDLKKAEPASEAVTPGDHIAYTRVREGKVETINAKGYSPKKDKILRTHTGPEGSPEMKHVSHVAQEFEPHVVSDPKTGQPFTVHPKKDVYEEHDMVMVAKVDSNEMMGRYFKGKSTGKFDPVVLNDVKELQSAGDLSHSNSDEVAGYVKNHYNEHIGSIGYVQSIQPASENEAGEDLYGVVSISDLDADGSHHEKDDDGNSVNRNHVHYYKADELLPADPDDQGEHTTQSTEGSPKQEHKYIRREMVKGEYRYIYEEPDGSLKSYDQDGYLSWVKEKRDDVVGGTAETPQDHGHFSSWRDSETGDLNEDALSDLDDDDFIAYGGKIAQNNNQEEWVNHLQDQISLTDVEKSRGSLAQSDTQISHLVSELDDIDPEDLASVTKKRPIELTAIHMDSSGMLMRDRSGKIIPDKFMIDRIKDGYLSTGEDTQKLASVLSDYVDWAGENKLSQSSLASYTDKFLENDDFNENIHLASYQAMSMLASANDKEHMSNADVPWDRSEVQKALSSGKNLMSQGKIQDYLSQEDRVGIEAMKREQLLGLQKQVTFNIPATIKTEVEFDPGNPEPFAPHFYQNQMANWMNGVGSGINGSDTGMGKTFQAIMATESLVENEGHDGAIIFAPIVMQEGWIEEIEKFVVDGQSSYVKFERAEALEGLSADLKDKKYIILPYSLLQGDENDPAHRNRLSSFESVIGNRKIYFDEGIGLSNEDTRTYRSLENIVNKSKGVIELNATPMAGDPRDLHNKMALYQPGLLPEWDVFKEETTVAMLDDEGKEIGRVWDEEKAAHLFESTLSPYVFMKYVDDPGVAEVLKLPEKREKGHRSTMTGFQKTLYDAVNGDMLTELLNKPYDLKMANLLQNKQSLLRQISFHPRMLEEHTNDPEVLKQIRSATSAKWEDSLNNMRVHFRDQEKEVAAGKRSKASGVMVPVAHVRVSEYMKTYFQEQLGLEKHEVAVIRGGMKSDTREGIRQGFNTGRIKVLLLGQQAAGYGMNAQRNCNLIEELDDSWGPTFRKQYLARIIRPGNKEPRVNVNVYRDSSDEITGMEGRIQSKSHTVNMFVGDNSTTPTITDQDGADRILLDTLEASNMSFEEMNRIRSEKGQPPIPQPKPPMHESLAEITSTKLKGSRGKRKETDETISKLAGKVNPKEPTKGRVHNFESIAEGIISDRS